MEGGPLADVAQRRCGSVRLGKKSLRPTKLAPWPHRQTAWQQSMPDGGQSAGSPRRPHPADSRCVDRPNDCRRSSSVDVAIQRRSGEIKFGQTAVFLLRNRRRLVHATRVNKASLVVRHFDGMIMESSDLLTQATRKSVDCDTLRMRCTAEELRK